MTHPTASLTEKEKEIYNSTSSNPELRYLGKKVKVIHSTECYDRANITPEIAIELKQGKYALQRTLQTHKVNRFVQDIKDNVFNANSSPLILVHYNDLTVVANGQHRIEAVLKAQKPITVFVKHVETSSLAEFIKTCQSEFLYGEGGNRTQKDKQNSFAITYEFTPKETQALLAGVKMLMTNFKATSRHTQDLSDLQVEKEAEEWVDTFREYLNILKSCKCKYSARMLLRSVVAVALATLKYQKSIAVPFWADIAADNGLTSGQPQKILVNFLTKVTKEKKKEEQPERAAFRFQKGWNYYVEDPNKQRSMIKVPDSLEREGFNLKGTPFSWLGSN